MNANHYPSLDRCKKLTSLGFPKTEKSFAKHYDNKACIADTFDREYGEVISVAVCPSVMEMMDVIPQLNGEHWFSVEKCSNDYHVCMRTSSLHEKVAFDEPNLPNALADLIAWLVENSRLTFDKR